MISRLALATSIAMLAPAMASAQSAAQTAPAETVPALPPTAQPDPSPAMQAGATPPAQAVQDAAQRADTPQAAAVGGGVNDGAQAGDVVVTGRFVDTGAKSAMKMDVPVLDTPFSVSSYSQSFVKSLETTNVSDLYNYMTGLKKSGNTAYDITLRGFKSSGDDRNAIMVDGLPGLTGRYGSPPTIGIDHIELVKGPMSVLYGQIQPGGFVNLITKKPQQNAKTTFEVRGNTFISKYRNGFDNNGLTSSIDSTGPITADGNVLYRVVGQLGDNDGFRDYSNTRQEFIQPSLSVRIGPDTTLTGQLEYRHVREHFDVGLVAPATSLTAVTGIYDVNLAAPITTTYQQPADFRVETGKAGNLYLTHVFSDAWKFNGSYRHVRYNSDQKEFSNTNILLVQGAYRVQRRARQLQTRRAYDYGDFNVNGRFDTAGIDHRLLIGFNLGRDTVEENRLKFFNSSTRNATTGVCATGGTCLDIALYNPNYAAFPAFDSLAAVNPQLANQQTLLTDKITKSSNYGIYVSDLITFTPWLKASVGVRKFKETADVEGDRRNAPGVIRHRSDKRDFLPSAGLLLQPSRHVTIYSSYAESFVPADPAALDPNGVPGNLHPITAKQYEAGIKTENLLNDRLSMTAAVYRIDQDGQVTQNPCTFGTCSYQTGKGRSNGFEVEGNASPIQNLQVIFGYSHIDAKILSSSILPFQVGRRLPNVAKDAANLWTRYDLENGLGLGLGVTYTGPREGLLPTAATDLKTLPLPGYTVVDAGIYFTQERYSFNLKFGNIFDRKYYESAGATARIQVAPGQPRYVTLTARASF